MIPDDDLTGPISPLRYGPFKIEIRQGMILHLHRQPFISRVHGRPFRNRPGAQNALLLQAKIKVEAGGMVFMNDETELHGETLSGRGLEMENKEGATPPELKKPSYLR